jgi:hypothetical protein
LSRPFPQSGSEGEYSFNADTVGQTAYREGFGDSAVLLGNDRVRKSGFSGVPLFNPDADANGISHLDGRGIFLQALLGKKIQTIHISDFLLVFSQTFIPVFGINGRGMPAFHIRSHQSATKNPPSVDTAITCPTILA